MSIKKRLELGILPQPDDTTCGPTCLQAVYRFHGDELNLSEVISEVHRLDHGGTYAAYLGVHALRRGYRVRLFTYNLQVFDPTWFQISREGMIERLTLRQKAKAETPQAQAIHAYLDFMNTGGDVEFQDLNAKLIRGFLKRGIPILTGLSSTYLYQTMREHGPEMEDDDVRGDPSGHFVVLCGYDKEDRTVLVADPMHPNPAFHGLQYVVEMDRVVCAILLGILTHDADMLIIEKPAGHPAPLVLDLPLPTTPPSAMPDPPGAR
ncbi:MAG: C39 family peptidase [Phycisphaerales bacterium]